MQICISWGLDRWPQGWGGLQQGGSVRAQGGRGTHPPSPAAARGKGQEINRPVEFLAETHAKHAETAVYARLFHASFQAKPGCRSA